MACILALDTSSEACSVALIKAGEAFSVYEVVPRDHTRKIIPMVQQVLSESNTKPSDLECIAFGCGPGSFTGLRIAAGVTQGLAYGLDVGVIPVSTMEAMALEASEAQRSSRVAVAIDARMDEVYFGLFDVDGDSVTALLNEQVCKPELADIPEDIDGDESSICGVGTGWAFISRMNPTIQHMVEVKNEGLLAKAEYIARIAAVKYANGMISQEASALVSPEQAIPVYLRDSVAWKKLPGR